MNTDYKKSLVVISLLSFLACLGLYWVEQVARLSYFMTTPLKILLFVGLPFLYSKTNEGRRLANERKVQERKVQYKGRMRWTIGLVVGLVSGAIVLLAYSLLETWIDFDAISTELIQKLKITPAIFMWIGLYIIFVNSFIEEYFFRGFIFLNLYYAGSPKWGMLYASILFSVYHMSIFSTWFNPVLIGLALFGLMAIGFVFNVMDRRNAQIYNSWIAHLLADVAIIAIGCKMFGLF